jgi:hypothetical protein
MGISYPVCAIGIFFLVIAFVGYSNGESGIQRCNERSQQILDLRNQFSQNMVRAHDYYLETGDPYYLDLYNQASSSYYETFSAEASNESARSWSNTARATAVFLGITGIIVLLVGILGRKKQRSQEPSVTSEEEPSTSECGVVSEYDRENDRKKGN